MPINELLQELQEMKGEFGSQRSFDAKSLPFQRAWSQFALRMQIADSESNDEKKKQEQGCWASMPPELLRTIIQRVEERAGTWPSRRDIVVCASVCKAWRDVTKDVVKPPELSGKLTFPISVKQPGPRDSTVQCFVKRDRVTSTYYLYISLTSTLAEHGKFLLAARKFRRATSSDYIISLDADDMSRGGDTYVGKLRSNFLGTKFAIYESHPSQYGTVASISRPSKRLGPKQSANQHPTQSVDVAHISYELSMSKSGPRRMQCTLYSVPMSVAEESKIAAVHDISSFVNQACPSLSLLRSYSSLSEASVVGSQLSENARKKDVPFTLKNKSPKWHEQLQCWCLNFKGRVTVASVKNFQLVASEESTHCDEDKVILQFGKIGKDTFTMDYRYPLSAFQAFAICLSSFDTKLSQE